MMKRNVPGLSQEKVNKFSRHKTCLIKLTRKVSIKENRKILVQKMSFIFAFPSCSLNRQSSKQNSLVMNLIRKVYLTQQGMLKFIKEKRQDSLSPNL